jgi:hypothetical protein
MDVEGGAMVLLLVEGLQVKMSGSHHSLTPLEEEEEWYRSQKGLRIRICAALNVGIIQTPLLPHLSPTNLPDLAKNGPGYKAVSFTKKVSLKHMTVGSYIYLSQPCT